MIMNIDKSLRKSGGYFVAILLLGAFLITGCEKPAYKMPGSPRYIMRYGLKASEDICKALSDEKSKDKGLAVDAMQYLTAEQRDHFVELGGVDYLVHYLDGAIDNHVHWYRAHPCFEFLTMLNSGQMKPEHFKVLKKTYEKLSQEYPSFRMNAGKPMTANLVKRLDWTNTIVEKQGEIAEPAFGSMLEILAQYSEHYGKPNQKGGKDHREVRKIAAALSSAAGDSIDERVKGMIEESDILLRPASFFVPYMFKLGFEEKMWPQISDYLTKDKTYSSRVDVIEALEGAEASGLVGEGHLLIAQDYRRKCERELIDRIEKLSAMAPADAWQSLKALLLNMQVLGVRDLVINAHITGLAMPSDSVQEACLQYLKTNLTPEQYIAAFFEYFSVRDRYWASQIDQYVRVLSTEGQDAAPYFSNALKKALSEAGGSPARVPWVHKLVAMRVLKQIGTKEELPTVHSFYPDPTGFVMTDSKGHSEDIKFTVLAFETAATIQKREGP